MNRFLNQVEQLPDLDFLTQFEDSYHLKEFKLPQITAAFAAEIYHDIFLKWVLTYLGSWRIMHPERNYIGGKTNSDSSCGHLPAICKWLENQ